MKIAMIAWALCSVALPVAGQLPCDLAPGDSSVRTIVALLDRVASAPPVWDSFSPANGPVILALDTALFRGTEGTLACALVWRSRTALRVVELTALPRLSTPLYGFVSLDPAGPNAQTEAEGTMAASRRIPAADQERLRSAGATRAAMLPVPLDLAKLGQFGEMLKAANVDPSLVQAELMVHEGFHLHVQFPTWLDQSYRPYAWPVWDMQPDRRQMRETCYAHSSAVVEAFNAEVGALLEAFDALHGVAALRDTATARAGARKFIELRRARYGLLDTITVPQGSRRIGCALAESYLELEEGTAQWIGHATLVNAGIRQMRALRGSYGAAQPDAFYRTGPLQLWILEAFVGREGTRALTTRLARAAGPEAGLFAEFVAIMR